jgi:hypothetical protein
MKQFLFSAILLLLFVNAIAQKTDKRLQKQIAAILKYHNGDVSVYVKTLFSQSTVVLIPI